jgi:hypothetical protein
VFSFGGIGCSFVHQVFDATYAGSVAVGPVTLHMEGCTPPLSGPNFVFSGTITIATRVGSLSGTTSFSYPPSTSHPIPVNMAPNLPTRTGVFRGVSGNLRINGQWFANRPDTPEVFTGTVSVA